MDYEEQARQRIKAAQAEYHKRVEQAQADYSAVVRQAEVDLKATIDDAFLTFSEIIEEERQAMNATRDARWMSVRQAKDFMRIQQGK